MAALRKATGVKISAGKSEFPRFACRDLMADGAIDICNFDASWGGGRPMAACRGVRSDAQRRRHPAHQPQIGCMLVGGVSNGTYLEGFLEWRDPFFYRLIADQKPFRNGKYLRCRTRPAGAPASTPTISHTPAAKINADNTASYQTS